MLDLTRPRPPPGNVMRDFSCESQAFRFPGKNNIQPTLFFIAQTPGGAPDSPFCRAGAQGSTRTRVRARQALFVFCLHASPEEDK